MCISLTLWLLLQGKAMAESYHWMVAKCGRHHTVKSNMKAPTKPQTPVKFRFTGICMVGTSIFVKLWAITVAQTNEVIQLNSGIFWKADQRELGKGSTQTNEKNTLRLQSTFDNTRSNRVSYPNAAELIGLMGSYERTVQTNVCGTLVESGHGPKSMWKGSSTCKIFRPCYKHCSAYGKKAF